jgi:hypothetical protein
MRGREKGIFLFLNRGLKGEGKQRRGRGEKGRERGGRGRGQEEVRGEGARGERSVEWKKGEQRDSSEERGKGC